MIILGRYIIREHVAPFIISISLIMFLFTLNLALRMLGRIVGQGLELMVILEFFFLNLAWIITLAVPMSVLVACLMGFGRLAGDREIIAMKSSGIGLIQMIMPVLIAATLVSVFSLFFQDQILPDMNHRSKLLSLSIRRKKPNVALREGIFTRDLPRQTLLVKQIDPETELLRRVSIFDESKPEEPSTVAADSGRFEYVDSLGMYHLHLYDGEIHQAKREEPETYEIIRYREALFRIDASDQILHRREHGYRGDRELGLAALRKRIGDLSSRANSPAFKRQIDRYLVEYHKKWAISVAAIVFVLIGAPLGIKLHHGGLGVSGPLAILFFLIYWSFLIGGEDLADRGIVSPVVAMWAPNFLLTLMGLFLIRLEMRQHTVIRFPWQRQPGDHINNKRGWKDLSPDTIEEFARQEAELHDRENPDRSESTDCSTDTANFNTGSVDAKD